jgi:hypothetical protein
MLFGVGVSTLKSYDLHHMIEVRCVATSARADVASSQAANGVGSFDRQVVIGTSCGKLILKRGVSRDNMQKIADAVEIDRYYMFSVGKGVFRPSFDIASLACVARNVRDGAGEECKVIASWLPCSIPRIESSRERS